MEGVRRSLAMPAAVRAPGQTVTGLSQMGGVNATWNPGLSRDRERTRWESGLAPAAGRAGPALASLFCQVPSCSQLPRDAVTRGGWGGRTGALCCLPVSSADLKLPHVTHSRRGPCRHLSLAVKPSALLGLWELRGQRPVPLGRDRQQLHGH